MAGKPEKKLRFEDALKRLEEIVAAMESEELDLDKSLGMFEEGVKLARFCTSKLEDAKKKISIIEKTGNKKEIKPFEQNEEL
jgi:exodeoxyribonuclease VII small subunit